MCERKNRTSGPLYKPGKRDFEPQVQEVCPNEAARLKSIWRYWEADDAPEPEQPIEDELHPDHRVH